MTPEELFKKLAEKRKELDLSLEEVVEKTKLYPSVIRDIEAGNLENINLAYRKGFVRIYASFLGVELSGVLDEISSVAAAAVKKETRAARNIENKPKIALAIKPLSPKTKKIIILTFTVLFILWSLSAVVSFIGKRISRLPKKPARSTQKEQPVIFTNQPKAREIVISLTAKRTCFLRVKVDGKLVFEGQLRKGVVEIWKGAKEIELLKISDGSAVYLEVNSKSIPPLTTSHKAIKSLRITASGISVVK